MVNVVFSFVPTLETMAMIATEMPAAMRPYSMAVAPDSLRKKEVTRFITVLPTVLCQANGRDGLCEV